MFSFTHPKDMIGFKNFKNGSRDSDHASFGLICHPLARTCYDKPTYILALPLLPKLKCLNKFHFWLDSTQQWTERLYTNIQMTQFTRYNCTVSQKVTTLACYNFDTHQSILIIFGRNVAKKVRSQMVLYFLTLPN